MDEKKHGACCGLTLIRFWAGIWFLWAGYSKLNAAYLTGGGFEGYVQKFMEAGSVGFYKTCLASVLAHAKIFSILTAFGELAAGLSLLLGFMTILSSVGVIIMCLNYLLATWNFGPASIGLNITMIICGIAFIVGKAGGCLGLDAKFCPMTKKCCSG
ncbi:MAG: DoxX family membrane protein [Deltaproteobacteria bacterium]|nr:DoxX family membrane protein [Deltaproteobacteria bacterium]